MSLMESEVSDYLSSCPRS